MKQTFLILKEGNRSRKWPFIKKDTSRNFPDTLNLLVRKPERVSPKSTDVLYNGFINGEPKEESTGVLKPEDKSRLSHRRLDLGQGREQRKGCDFWRGNSTQPALLNRVLTTPAWRQTMQSL